MTKLTLKTGLICLMLSALLAGGAWAGGVLGFVSEARVTGNRVTLLDLVQTADSLDAQAKAALGAQMVMSAPRLGRTAKISGSRIRSLLRQAKLPVGYSILIPPQIMISSQSQRISTRQMANAFRSTLTKRLGERAKQADIHSIQAGREVVVPAGELEISVRIMSKSLMGRVTGQVDILVDGSRAAQRRIEAVVDLYGPVVVARSSLSRGHIIGKHDVRVVKLNRGAISKAVATATGDVIGLRTKGPVPAGEPLALNRLERAPLIKRGDVVTMIWNDHGFKITAKGKAEETGYKGESIRLLNLASKREVYGRVRSPGSVIVDY